MAELKTKPEGASVSAFLSQIHDPQRRQDCEQLALVMAKVTGEEPKMWGDSIVGFGSHRYKYASGREGDWFVTGFSPRKQALTLYIMAGFSEYEELLAKLGKFKIGKSCLYVKKLEDVDSKVLTKLLRASVGHVRKASK